MHSVLFILVSISLQISTVLCDTRIKNRYQKAQGATLSFGCAMTHYNMPGVDLFCGMKCAAHTLCQAFCVREGECTLINGFMALKAFDNEEGDLYTACYTNWGSVADLIHRDTVYTASSEYSSQFAGDNSFDGIACAFPHHLITRFSTTKEVDAWLQIDFLKTVRINEIQIVAYIQQEFQNIDVFLGNSPDFSNSPLYLTAVTAANNYDVNSFKGDNTLVGRYLTFLKRDGDVQPLSFFDLHVFGG